MRLEREKDSYEKIIGLVKSTRASRAVTKFLTSQVRIFQKESKVLQSVGSSKVTLDVNTSIDHVLTICRKSVTKEEYQKLLLDVGNIFKMHGEFDRAAKTFNEALDYGRKTKNDENVALSFLELGDVYSRQGKWQESQRNLEISRKLFSRLKNFGSLAKVENILGTSFAEQGLLKKANRYFSIAIQYAERSHQKEIAGTIFMNLGIIQNIIGNWDGALNNYRRALSQFDMSENLTKIMEVHHNIGMSFFSKKDYANALKSFDKSLEYSIKNNNPVLIGISKLSKANTYFKQADFPLALALCNQALEQNRITDDRLSIADAYKLKGMILREMKEFEPAMTFFQSSLRINEEYQNLLNLAETYREIGVMEQYRKRTTAAKNAYSKAIGYFHSLGAKADERETGELLKSLTLKRN